MNILCMFGFHDFPKMSEYKWVICRRYCCTEKNLITRQVVQARGIVR